MESKRVTVTDTPTLIHEAQRNHGSETVTLSIAGGLTNIDVGGPNVSSGAGYEMADGSREVLELRAGQAIYGVAPSASSSEVQVLYG